LHHIEVRILSPRQVGFELRCAGREKFSSFKLRRAAMLERQTSQKIAHYLLDFLCKQSVSGGNGAPVLIGSRL
jgi:hypothetical protein